MKSAVFVMIVLFFMYTNCSPSTSDIKDLKASTSDQPNNAPIVSTGSSSSVVFGQPLVLSGSSSDDGLPAGSSLSHSWSKVSGPGAVTFANSFSAVTTASFSAVGSYVIQLTASDGLLTTSQNLGVTVVPSGTAEPNKFNCNFYASTTGTSQGNGSVGNPWDLQTALYQPAGLVAGSTLCLKGGVYKGSYQSFLTGTSTAPIKVRSAPGEWARLDSHAKTTLARPLLATDTSITLTADVFPHRLPEHAIQIAL